MLQVGSILLRKSSRYPLLGQATLDTSRRKDRKSRKYCRKPAKVWLRLEADPESRQRVAILLV